MPNNPLITILTVNYNTSDFIEAMLYAFKKLTKNKYKVIICDNGSNAKNILNLIKIARSYDNVELIFRVQSQKGSIAHAEAMDILISKITTPYFVTMDADAIMLMKDWDAILISRLDDKVKLIGTSPLNGDPLKAVNFPLVYAVLYETEVFKRLDCSMMPSLGRDTAWQVEDKYTANGFRGKAFEGRSTRIYKSGAFGAIFCVEYYLEGYKDIFACHFGRGSSDGGVKFYRSNLFFKLPVISKMLIHFRALKQKDDWIKICRKVVDEKINN